MLIKELRAIASRRTAGEWSYSVNHPIHDAPTVCADGKSKGGVFVCSCNTSDDQSGVKDAEFISCAARVFDRLLDIAEAAERLCNFSNVFDNEDDECRFLQAALAALEADEGEK